MVQSSLPLVILKKFSSCLNWNVLMVSPASLTQKKNLQYKGSSFVDRKF